MTEQVIVDIYAAAAAAGVKPSLLRSWVHRRKVSGYGYDRAGRALVDVAEVQAFAEARRLDQIADLL